MKLEVIALKAVEVMPRQLEVGVLYVSEKYGAAAHLCACGCGSKIRTPLGPTEWVVTQTPCGPSMWPSVGNWQKACQSHYIIKNGRIRWCDKWTPEQIRAGRRKEEKRRNAYYVAMYAPRGVWGRVWQWLKARWRMK